MKQTLKTTSPFLVYAFYILMFNICSYFATVTTSKFSSDFIVSSNAVSNILNSSAIVFYSMIVLSLLIKLPQKTVEYITIGLELLFIAIFTLFPAPLVSIQVGTYNYDNYYSHCITILRYTGIYMLIGSIISYGISKLLKPKGNTAYLLEITIAGIITIVMNAAVLYGGTASYGNPLGLLQPFRIFPILAIIGKVPVNPIANLNIKTDNGNSIIASGAKSKYTFLDKYKESLKKGSE